MIRARTSASPFPGSPTCSACTGRTRTSWPTGASSSSRSARRSTSCRACNSCSSTARGAGLPARRPRRLQRHDRRRQRPDGVGGHDGEQLVPQPSGAHHAELAVLVARVLATDRASSIRPTTSSPLPTAESTGFPGDLGGHKLVGDWGWGMAVGSKVHAQTVPRAARAGRPVHARHAGSLRPPRDVDLR